MSAKLNRPPFSFGRMIRDESQCEFGGTGPRLTDEQRAVELDFAANSPVMTGGLHHADLRAFAGRPSVRAGIDSLTTSTGGVFKITQPGDLLAYTLQRNIAATLMHLVAPTSLSASEIVPLTTSGAQWVAENSGADVTPMAPTAGAVSVALKTLQASTSFSRQIIYTAAGGGVDAEQYVIDALAKVIAVAIDLAAFNGLGSSNQPLGLLNNTAISTVAMGAQGAPLDVVTATALDLAVAQTNAPGARSFVTTPNVQAKGKATQAFTSGGVALWTDADTIVGRSAYATTSLPANLTKGTTTGCSSMLFGAFEDAVLAIAPVFGLLVDPYTKKNQNMIEVTATLFVDVAVARAGSFRRVLDLTTT